MNLINDRWIPIRRADGSQSKIAPWEMTDNYQDDKKKIIAISSPRPDFDGALMQFLIGLLQTTYTPETEDAWWDWQENPPNPETLKVYFKPYKKAFNLHERKTEEGNSTNYKLFMQEGIKGVKRAISHPVSYLLIEAPKDNALKNKTDHFQKRPKTNEFMCKDCAAAALYTMQAFSPGGGGGGKGKNTSIRGGGPLSTIVLGNNLWDTIWLNIIIGKDFYTRKCSEKTFPWLNIENFISETNQVKTVHSQEMNPEHVFWGMPRRIQLDFCTFNSPKICSVCSAEGNFMCQGFFDLTGGLTYQKKRGSTKVPSWISPLHPLSPYRVEGNLPRALHQRGEIAYRHWLGYVQNFKNEETQYIPAKVVEQFRNIIGKDGQLWAYGFDMDNAKARCWYDAKMPILLIGKEKEEVFQGLTEQLIQSANWIADNLTKKLKEALFGELEIRGNFSFIKTLFWRQTENIFYQTMHQLRDSLLTNIPPLDLKSNWHNELAQEALAIFDQKSQTGDFDAIKPRRVATARNELARIIYGKKVKEFLGLPVKNTKNENL